jgi:hypothetical protein
MVQPDGLQAQPVRHRASAVAQLQVPKKVLRAPVLQVPMAQLENQDEVVDYCLGNWVSA